MSLRDLTLAAVLASGLVTVLALADPFDSDEPKESIRDLVYWGPGGPIHIRLHLQIDGRPAALVWTHAIDVLFHFCDRNDDGVLDTEELAPFNEPRGRNPQVFVDGTSTPALRLSFEDRKAKATRAQFNAALRAAGFEPVNLAITQAQPSSERLSAALFRRLDRDGDGKLSKAELRDARTQLDFFDANEDELISVAELLGRIETNPQRVILRRANPVASTNSSPDLIMLPGEVDAALTQILATRGDARSKVIGRTDFGGAPETFAALDKNKDGRLDAAELEAWLKQPPELELRIALSSSRQSDKNTILSKSDNGMMRVEANPSGELNSVWSKLSFRFEQPGTAMGARAAWNRLAENTRKQLKAAADKTGAIKRQDLTNQPDLLSFFDFASRKTEGKLKSVETEAALEVIGQLAGCRLVINVRDQGTGLFELLDQNGDGQLAPRELVDAEKVLKPFADAGGKIGPGDLPRRFIVAAAAGSVPAVLSSTAPVMTAARERPALPDLPAWFTNMDRNGDGEVSLREFLGPLEQFRKLDKNGDGLISPDEARDANFD